MDTLLLDIAAHEHITVSYDNILPRFKALGLYDNDGYRAQIILHTDLKYEPRLLRCVFAEELGHHFTSAGPSFYKSANFQFWKLIHKKIELKALKWSAYKFVDDAELLTLIRQGLQTARELSEERDITQELAEFRLRLFQSNPPRLPRDKELRKEILFGQTRLDYM